MALTGGDEIQIHLENDNHNDDHNDDTGNDQDTTGTAAATGSAAGGSGTTSFNLRVEQNKIPGFFGSKSKDTISAADFYLPTGGSCQNKQVLKPTTTLPTHSGIRLENGSLQWSTGTMMSTINHCGQISRKSSNKNMLNLFKAVLTPELRSVVAQ
jgi:hypothetical protein